MVPRALLLRARSEARLGHGQKARAALEHLKAQRAGGDPGDPLVAEVQALLAAR